MHAQVEKYQKKKKYTANTRANMKKAEQSENMTGYFYSNPFCLVLENKFEMQLNRCNKQNENIKKIKKMKLNTKE